MCRQFPGMIAELAESSTLCSVGRSRLRLMSYSKMKRGRNHKKNWQLSAFENMFNAKPVYCIYPVGYHTVMLGRSFFDVSNAMFSNNVSTSPKSTVHICQGETSPYAVSCKTQCEMKKYTDSFHPFVSFWEGSKKTTSWKKKGNEGNTDIVFSNEPAQKDCIDPHRKLFTCLLWQQKDSSKCTPSASLVLSHLHNTGFIPQKTV